VGVILRTISLCYQQKKWKSHVVVDALSRRHTLLISLGY